MDYSLLLTMVAWLGLVTMRIAVAFIVTPLFAPTLFTGTARAMIIVVLALVPMTVVPFEQFAVNQPLVMGGMLVREAFVGLLIGFLISLPIWVVHNVGAVIDLLTGSSNASFFDPLTGHEGGPLPTIMQHLFVALFLAAGGFTLIAEALYDSYRIWPVGAPLPHFDALFQTFWISRTESLFSASVKLVAPVAIALVAVDFTLGLINRFVPQFNIFDLSPALKGGVALLVLYAVFAFFAEQVLQSIASAVTLPSLYEALGRP